VVFVLPPGKDEPAGAPDVQFACSRMVVRQWSPAFEALIRHGNGLANTFPKEIRLGETEAPVFQIVRDFMCSRELSEEVVGQVADATHPVLELADRYDLQALKDEYAALMSKREPFELPNAVHCLKLAIRYNIKDIREQAVLLLAKQVSFSKGRIQFFSLSSDLAGEVIACDELKIYDNHELATLNLVREWVSKEPERTGQVWEVLQNVRFGLLGFKELTELQRGLATDKEFSGASTQVNAAIRAALEDKLDAVSEVPRPLRKRKFTALVEGTAEEDCAKALRMARSLKLFVNDAT